MHSGTFVLVLPQPRPLLPQMIPCLISPLPLALYSDVTFSRRPSLAISPQFQPPQHSLSHLPASFSLKVTYPYLPYYIVYFILFMPISLTSSIGVILFPGLSQVPRKVTYTE